MYYKIDNYAAELIFLKLLCYLKEKNEYLEQFENNHKMKFFENPDWDYLFVTKRLPVSPTIPSGLNN